MLKNANERNFKTIEEYSLKSERFRHTKMLEGFTRANISDLDAQALRPAEKSNLTGKDWKKAIQRRYEQQRLRQEASAKAERRRQWVDDWLRNEELEAQATAAASAAAAASAPAQGETLAQASSRNRTKAGSWWNTSHSAWSAHWGPPQEWHDWPEWQEWQEQRTSGYSTLNTQLQSSTYGRSRSSHDWTMNPPQKGKDKGKGKGKGKGKDRGT